MLLKLLHDDFMRLILKENDFVEVVNEVFYVFTLLNDFIQRFNVYFMKNKIANNILIVLKKFFNSFIKDRYRTFRFKNDDDDEFIKVFNRYCEKHDTKYK